MENKEFAKYIKGLRLKRNLTMKQVELYAGISNSYISMIENGKRDIPSPEILAKLAPLYKVPYEELMQKAGYIGDEVYTIERKELPKEISDLGVDYIKVTKELKEQGLSPDDIRELYNIVRKIKGL